MMRRSDIRKRRQKAKRKKYGIILGIIVVIFVAINSINGNEKHESSVSHDRTEKKHIRLFKKKISKESEKIDNENKPEKKIVKKEVIKKPKIQAKPKKQIKQKTAVKKVQPKKNKPKKNKKEDRLKKINIEIRKRLKEDQGFALGQLDENGHPTENGTPNLAFAWSVVVKRIEYENNGNNGKGMVKVYVTDSFKGLSTKERDHVALMSQNVAGSIVGESYKFSMEEYRNGLMTLVSCDGNIIGKSKFTDQKEFKWISKYFE